MKKRWLAALIGGGLLLALASVAAACGGGGAIDPQDRQALEEYFQEVKAKSDEAEEKNQALVDGVPLEFATEAEEIDATRRYVEGLAAIVTDFVAALEAIEPPPQVREAHEETVGAAEDWAGLLEDLGQQIQGVETVAELDKLFNDPAAGNANERFGRGCQKLQEIADANEIAVDLGCGA